MRIIKCTQIQKIEDKPFDNKRLIDMMVDQVINDMESFKDDKVAVLHQIDSMEENSDKLIDDILNNKKNTTKIKKIFLS